VIFSTSFSGDLTNLFQPSFNSHANEDVSGRKYRRQTRQTKLWGHAEHPTVLSLQSGWIEICLPIPKTYTEHCSYIAAEIRLLYAYVWTLHGA
jgi:hypothetical protein